MVSLFVDLFVGFLMERPSDRNKTKTAHSLEMNALNFIIKRLLYHIRLNYDYAAIYLKLVIQKNLD